MSHSWAVARYGILGVGESRSRREGRIVCSYCDNVTEAVRCGRSGML